MNGDDVLAFRLARSGLGERRALSLAEAAACPASDFHRDAALVALAARTEHVTRETYDDAVDAGDVVVAHVIRGAIHAVAPDDFALYGRSLLSRDDRELGAQLGRQVRGLTDAPVAALDEVAAATEDALAGGPLDKNALHEALRPRVRKDLMPWCRGCGSHHVAPMLWRYGTVKAGVRMDSRRRYTLGEPGPAPDASEIVRRFLRFYGPATPADLADWAGLAKPHAKRLWDQVEVHEVEAGRWLLPEDVGALESPPQARGIRLLAPGDPYLQKPNRRLLAPDAELRKRLFRPVASPGVVLKDGRAAGTWRFRGGTLEADCDAGAEAQRVSALLSRRTTSGCPARR